MVYEELEGKIVFVEHNSENGRLNDLARYIGSDGETMLFQRKDCKSFAIDADLIINMRLFISKKYPKYSKEFHTVNPKESIVETESAVEGAPVPQPAQDLPPINKYAQFGGRVCTVAFYGPGGVVTGKMKLVGINNKSLFFEYDGQKLTIDKADISKIELYESEEKVRARLASLGDYGPGELVSSIS